MATLCALVMSLFLAVPAQAIEFEDGYPRLGSESQAISGLSLKTSSGSVQTTLFPLYTRRGNTPDQLAYCVELSVNARYNTDMLVGGWDSFPGDNNFRNNPGVRTKVAWIVSHSYPKVDLNGLAAAAGAKGLTQKEAIAGSQAAIWSLTDSAPASSKYVYAGLAGSQPAASQDRVTALFKYLTGDANTGETESEAPHLSSTGPADGESGTAGSLVGPVRFQASSATLRVANTSSHPLVLADGSSVDSSVVPTDTDLFLKVPADAKAGSAELSATLVGPQRTGMLVTNTKPRTQTLMIARSDQAEVKTSVKVSWAAQLTVKTSARDGVDGDDFLPATGEASVVDVVKYTGLIPGKEYRVAGELMLRDGTESGKPTGIKAEATFTPEQADGSVELTFVVSADALQGQTIVVFERLFQDKIEVAVHADINDEDQTVYRPAIQTDAYNIDTDEQTFTHVGGTLHDKVSYSGLKPGTQYRVTGEVMDQDTGEGTGIVGETEFTPETSSGTTTVSFTVPPEHAGSTLVVFEKLYAITGDDQDDVLLAVHEDLDDQRQTVTVAPYEPKIGTSARDGVDGDDFLPETGEASVVDEVKYTGLIPGREYRVAGELMVRDGSETGTATGITAEATFTPEAPDGSVELVFTIPADQLQGETIVVFERLFQDKKEVAVHADIKDEKQTMYRPAIDTDAYDFSDFAPEDDPDRDELDRELPETGGTLRDYVSYSGLKPGATYRLAGTIMNQTTGKSTGITAESELVPEEASGVAHIDFEVPAEYAGETLVVFERLYLTEDVKQPAVAGDSEPTERFVRVVAMTTLDQPRQETREDSQEELKEEQEEPQETDGSEAKLLATHEDLDAERQTVTVAPPKKTPPPTTPPTTPTTPPTTPPTESSKPPADKPDQPSNSTPKGDAPSTESPSTAQSDASPKKSSLARTGASVTVFIAMACALMLAGGATMLLRQRRSRRH